MKIKRHLRTRGKMWGRFSDGTMVNKTKPGSDNLKHNNESIKISFDKLLAGTDAVIKYEICASI